jgi:hypothetical protein
MPVLRQAFAVLRPTLLPIASAVRSLSPARGHSPQEEPWVLAVVATLETVRVLNDCSLLQADDSQLDPTVLAAWQGGEFLTDAAALAGTHRHRGLAWVREAGGVRPRRGLDLQGRYLSFAEREELALGRAAGESIRSIADRLRRSPSTISRELNRNRDPRGRYRATTAHALAYGRASRPKPAKLATNLALRACVEHDLAKKYSPDQIAGRLREDHPDSPEMWVSTETIYQSLYVQSRGALRRDLAVCLRTGRALRQPNRQGAQRKNRVLSDMINISERPAVVADRAVPGDWEGDLVRHEALYDRAVMKGHRRWAVAATRLKLRAA